MDENDFLPFVNQTIMKQSIFISVFILLFCGTLQATEGNDRGIPTLLNQPKTTVTVTEHHIVFTFGPLDLQTGPNIPMIANMAKQFFAVPQDMMVIGFTTLVFTKEGTPLPRHYLHHLSLLDLDKPSTFCPGAPYLIAGSGMELTQAHFPPGYGVQLKKGAKLLAIASFYHQVPRVTDVMATFILDRATPNEVRQPLTAYHVSVTGNCYQSFAQPTNKETEEGVVLGLGLQTLSHMIQFPIEGCVKFAYTHAHDYLALMVLENKTTQRTLLRTMPQVDQDGFLHGFSDNQVFSDPRGFQIHRQNVYRMMMVYYRPLQDTTPRFGMASYLLYMTNGSCR